MEQRWDHKDGELARAEERAWSAERERDELLAALDAARRRVERLEVALIGAAARAPAGAGSSYDDGVRDALALITCEMEKYRDLGVHDREKCRAVDREDALFVVAKDIRALIRGTGVF